MLSEHEIQTLRKMAEGKKWPAWLYEAFPMVLIYYRPNKPKPRKQRVGVKFAGKFKQVGNIQRPILVNVRKPYKKASTRDQNNYSYCTCLAKTPDSVGTIKRIMKHRGYSIPIAAVYATQQEIAREENTWRYGFRKYKTISELFNLRKLADPAWKELCDNLEKEYPTKSTGQLHLL